MSGSTRPDPCTWRRGVYVSSAVKAKVARVTVQTTLSNDSTEDVSCKLVSEYQNADGKTRWCRLSE